MTNAILLALLIETILLVVFKKPATAETTEQKGTA